MERPDLTGRTAAQIAAVVAYELLVMQTELLAHGRVRTAAEIEAAVA